MNPVAAQAIRRCCYTVMFVQAMVINLTPLFFIPLQREYGLSFEQLGRLVLVNFFTQMLVDLACTALLAAFGDAGAGGVPWLVGLTADIVSSSPEVLGRLIPPWLVAESPEALGMRIGLLAAGVFPALPVLVIQAVPGKNRVSPPIA